MTENILEVTESNFQEEVLESEIPVLVDFWAAWCGPCRQVAPIVDEIAEDYQGKVKVVKVDVDKVSELAGKYQVMSIPTLMIFKNGEVKETMIGVQPKEALTSKLEQVI